MVCLIMFNFNTLIMCDTIILSKHITMLYVAYRNEMQELYIYGMLCFYAHYFVGPSKLCIKVKILPKNNSNAMSSEI